MGRGGRTSRAQGARNLAATALLDLGRSGNRREEAARLREVDRLFGGGRRPVRRSTAASRRGTGTRGGRARTSARARRGR